MPASAFPLFESPWHLLYQHLLIVYSFPALAYVTGLTSGCSPRHSFVTLIQAAALPERPGSRVKIQKTIGLNRDPQHVFHN